MDDELRALLRRRDESPGDVSVARKAAQLAGRSESREEAASAWQEVLRRAPRDHEAEQRLRDLGCELLYRSTVLGIERFESTLDRSVLARTSVLPELFVAERPVSCEQLLRFLEEHPRAEDRGWIRDVMSSPYRFASGSVVLRGLSRSDPVRHATWSGAASYAAWAHGRLLAPEEWEKLLVLRAYGWEVHDEWAQAERHDARGQAEHPIVSPAGTRWVRERSRYEGPAFRYARASWFASPR